MKNLRKITKILLSVTLIGALFTGCSSSDVKRVKSSTAEEAIELFNKYNEEDNVEEMVKLYSDVYMDAVGYTTGTIVKMLKENRKDVDVTKSEVVSVEDIDENTKKAEILSTTKNKEGEEESYTYVYGILKEEGGWSVSPDGVIGFVNYDQPEMDKDALNFYLSKTIDTFDGTVFRVEVYNYTTGQYQFGEEDDFCQIIVETTEGEYTTSMESVGSLAKKTQTYFTAKVEDIKGDVTKITLTNVYDLDSEGNIIEDSKRDVVVYEKNN